MNISAAAKLRTPYLIFLGAVDAGPASKTAFGLRDWAPELCRGQLRLPGCQVDLGLPEMSVADAAGAGVGSLLIGVAAAGGAIPEAWHATLREAALAGLDIVSGMHTRLADVPGLTAAAQDGRANLVDVRHPRQQFPTANGRKRTGKRLLTVGTDCALGKKYTALALTRALQARGVPADFRATGQTGIMISGSGIAIDAVVADFIAGAAELLSPDAAADHWDVIEGQGSLFHPAYAGVTTGLIHGSQPDLLILCHDPQRTHINYLQGVYPLPSLTDCAALNLTVAKLTNPNVRLGGVSLNTAGLSEDVRARLLELTEQQMGVPCFDPLKTPLDRAVDAILAEA